MKGAEMRGRRWALATVWVVAFAVVSGLWLGLSATEVQAQGRNLLVVPFERDNIDDIFYTTLMKQARDSAGGAAEYVALDPVDSELTELLFGVGCDEATVECMQLVAETFGADVIMYGKIWNNDRGIYLEVKLFDAQLGGDLLEDPVERSFQSDDKETLLKMAVGEIQQVFYPFTGELTVASTEPATAIIFDGAEVGNTSNGPVRLSGVRLGEHVLTARTDSNEVTQTIILLHDEPQSLTIDPTVPAVSGGGVASGPGFQHWGSSIAFGVGTAGLVTGAIFSVLVNTQNNEVERLAGQNVVNASEANDTLSKGDRLNSLQFVFYGIGAAAVTTGAVLYLFEGGDEAGGEASGSRWIAPMATDEGVGAAFGGTF